LRPPPGYDWQAITRKLISYFSRRQALNAKDLTQEVLVRLFAWIEKGGSVTSSDDWMKLAYGFARNVLREGARADHRAPGELLIDIEQPERGVDGMTERETIVFIGELLRLLPEEERRLLERAEEISPEDHAKELDIPIATLRTHLFRTRRKLKKLYYLAQKRDPRE